MKEKCMSEAHQSFAVQRQNKIKKGLQPSSFCRGIRLYLLGKGTLKSIQRGVN